MRKEEKFFFFPGRFSGKRANQKENPRKRGGVDGQRQIEENGGHSQGVTKEGARRWHLQSQGGGELGQAPKREKTTTSAGIWGRGKKGKDLADQKKSQQ